MTPGERTSGLGSGNQARLQTCVAHLPITDQLLQAPTGMKNSGRGSAMKTPADAALAGHVQAAQACRNHVRILASELAHHSSLPLP